MKPFNGVKVFSVTLARDREDLGGKVTEWLREHPGCEVAEMRVVQSSDREFHCVSLVLFFNQTL